MANESELSLMLAQSLSDGDDDAVASVYGEIAALQHTHGDLDGACFFWTQSLVYAMVAGNTALEQTLRETLGAHGRI